MTTTDMYQGMDTDSKPSSRVIRPPGGGSSNIFGTMDYDQPQRKPHQATTSNLFGAEDDSKEKVGKRQGGPPDNSRANVFGGSMVQESTRQDNKRRGQGDEFPAYDRSVYAANLTPQRRNKAQVSTFNPITGEDSPGHMAEEPAQRRGKRVQKPSTSEEGAFNPITGAMYDDKEREKTEEEKEEQQDKPAPQQQEVQGGPVGKTLPVHTSSRVLNPPGGKSTSLW